MIRLEKIVLQGFKSFKRPTAMVFPSNFVVVTGPNGCGKCVTGETLVHLSDGRVVRIDELVESKIAMGNAERMDDGYVARNDGSESVCCLDIVTMKSTTAPISAFVKRKSPSKLTKIKTRSGREITATDYHPLFVMKENRIESSNAGDLKEGMMVAIPRIIRTEPVKKDFTELPDFIKEEDALYVPWRQEYTDILKRTKKTTWDALAKDIGIPSMHIRCILIKQAVNAASVIKMLKHAGMGFEQITKLVPAVKSKSRNTHCNIPWRNSADFSRFLGYVLAEGRLTSSNQVWFTNADDEIVEDYRRLAESLFGLKPGVYEYKPGCWDVIIYSHALQMILKKFGMPKGRTKEKKLTNLFLSHSGTEEISGLLNGLYSGDGYVSDRAIELTTASKELAVSVGYLLSRLGIRFSRKRVIKIATNSGYSGEYWTLVSYGSENAAKFAENVNFTHNMKRERTIELARKKANPNVDIIPVNSLVKDVVRDVGIKVKRMKRDFPRLDSYCYTKTAPSVYGLGHLIDNLFYPQACKSGSIPHSLCRLMSLVQSDIIWDEIIGIESVDSPSEWVYDLSVEKHHNFVANGMFVHNSNLSESVAFVLGRTSSKHLRAKKAQDLIFHGSKSKPPADLAKVNLFFSNKGKILPVDDETVTVARTLNKEGVSSYRMNGKITTRQQILDIFTQARLNPGGHNIMKQGDVSKIIDMNPLERRGIIDEISGITEYDEKRDKAFKELEKVEVKVREAEIILEQKEQIVEKLRKDRDVALEYDKLQKELELVKATIVWKEFTSVEKNMDSIGSEIEEKERSLVSLEAEMRKIDAEMNAKEKEMESLMKEVMRKDQIEITSRISRLESSLEGKESMIEANHREIGRLNEMIRSLGMLGRDVSPNLKPVLQMTGVRGLVKDLVVVPEKYRVAAEVAAGPHMNDIVVESLQTAISCVSYLKENKIGRARFLPLDRIRASAKGQLPDGTLGWLSDLVHHDREYVNVVEYVLGTTACVNDLDKAKRISEKSRSRMVTLDGDLFETSGALFGGYYSRQGKASALPETGKYAKDIAKLEEENKILRLEIEETEKSLVQLRKQVKDTKTFDFESRMGKIKGETARLSERRREAYDRKATTQEEINRLRINRARYEANFENLNSQWEGKREKWDSLSEKEAYQKKGLQALKDMEKDVLSRISAIGPVNMKAVDEFDMLFEEFGEFKERVDQIVKEKDSIIRSITEIENRKREVFTATMAEMSGLFREIYRELTNGEADLGLEVAEDINSGLMISAQPPGKKLLYIDSMSGGEKALTALAFLFTIQQFKPSPFYVLDEVDAPLDKPNTKRVIDMVKKQSKKVQFIIITHNSEMVKAADIVYGISMEDGESKLIGIKLPEEGDNVLEAREMQEENN